MKPEHPKTGYKVLVSILFGLIGFILNFNAINFAQFVEFKASVLLGLLFPLLIALAWGWRFGLLSALAGGCQSLWWLWRTDGYGVLYAVPIFFLWIVWHGIWADYRKNNEMEVKWYHSMYVVELLFRLFSEPGFYTAFRWLVSFNPPPWDPNITWNHVPFAWVNFVAIKHVVTAYILLLVAHVLLSLGLIRKLFLMPPKMGQKSTTYLVSLFILLGMFLWALDSVVVYYAFSGSADPLLTAITSNISPRDLFARNTFLMVCFIAGLLVSKFLTERYEKEAALKTSEERFRSLFENMYDGVAIYRPVDQGDDFVFVDINKSGRVLSKVEKERVVGKRVTEICPAIKEMGLFQIFQHVFRTGEKAKLPMTQHGDDRVSEWVDNTVFKLASNEIVAVYRDESERHIAEEKIRRLNEELERRVIERTRQLKETNDELEDFVYSVSHDLRAPLRSIGGFAEIISRRHKDSLNEEGRHYFDNIVKAGKQMGQLIDDLLKFSRMGRKSIQCEAVPLENVLKETINVLSDQMEMSKARVDFPKTMPVIQGDRALTTHVFINLLENAIKYHKPNEAPEVDIVWEAQDESVVISVSDNGLGIAPEYHDKIFNIFQRLHNQEDYPGTGIGLAAVKKALQMMGGEVRVESELGQGSVFKVTMKKGKAS